VPVSDAYLVQYLLQETVRAQHGIVWRERSTEAGFVASVGSLKVALEAISSRGGSRLALQFRGVQDEFQIQEPLSQGWFGRHYSTPDESILADLLRDLMRAVETQCRERRLSALQNPEAVRDRVFRQLLFDAAEKIEDRAPSTPY
jgi:hypothetical protein